MKRLDLKMHEQDKRDLVIGLCLIVIVIFLAGVLGCKSINTIPPDPTPISTPVINHIPPPEPIPALSWENTTQPHPERKPWSQALYGELNKRFDIINTATDITKFCPKYNSLVKPQKLQALAELFVWLAYYESGFDPKSSSVDVGTWDDKNTYSIGLYSVSVVDQENYGFKDMHYSYNDLLTYGPNIELAVRLIEFQIGKVGKIAIGPDRKWLYFATLHPGGSYDETQNIIAKVKKLQFCN